MPNWRYDGSECQANQWFWMPDYELWLWTPNCEDGGSKLQSEEHDDFECQTKDVALNVELKKLITLNTKEEALNAQTEVTALNTRNIALNTEKVAMNARSW